MFGPFGTDLAPTHSTAFPLFRAFLPQNIKHFPCLVYIGYESSKNVNDRAEKICVSPLCFLIDNVLKYIVLWGILGGVPIYSLCFEFFFSKPKKGEQIYSPFLAIFTIKQGTNAIFSKNMAHRMAVAIYSIYIYIYVYIYICIYVCVYIYIYIYIYMLCSYYLGQVWPFWSVIIWAKWGLVSGPSLFLAFICCGFKRFFANSVIIFCVFLCPIILQFFKLAFFKKSVQNCSFFNFPCCKLCFAFFSFLVC